MIPGTGVHCDEIWLHTLKPPRDNVPPLHKMGNVITAANPLATPYVCEMDTVVVLTLNPRNM